MKNRLIALLRWSERYTKTDMVYLTSNVSWLTLKQIFLALVSLGLSFAFAHLVSKEMYGNYRYLQSLFWTLTALSLTGIPAALLRSVARGKDGTYKQAIRLSLLWSIPSALVALAISFYYFTQGNNVLAWGALTISVVGPFLQASYLFGSYLDGKRAFKTNALYGSILAGFPALFILTAMLFTGSASALFFVYLASNVFVACILTIFVWKKFKPLLSNKSESILNLGAHFSAMNFLSTVAQQLDRLLVYHFLGATELAIYSFATAVPDQVKGVFNNVGSIAFPKFANRPIKDIRASLWNRLFKFTLLMVLVSVSYILVAPYLFSVLFPSYSDAVFYSQIYALALIPIGSIFPTTILQAHAAKRELYFLNLSTSLIQILSVLLGVLWYGLLGVVIARGISRVLSFVIAQLLISYNARRTT